MVAGGFFLQQSPAKATPRLFDQVLSIVANRYVDSLQGNEVFEKAATGLVRELNDPYSELLAPKEKDVFDRSVGGRYGGVGMLLEEQKNGAGTSIVVARIFPNTPAEEGGVQEGDRIVRVDTMPAGNVKIDQVSDPRAGGAIRDHGRQPDRVYPASDLQREHRRRGRGGGGEARRCGCSRARARHA
jgi:carboxyl-terminal processing protease